jgi:uncharacterized membrane protein
MVRYLVSYVGAALAFVLMDACWLTLMGPKLYRPVIGDLLADQVRIVPAVLFYALYVVGIVALAVRPALRSGSWMEAAVLGGLLGLVAYGAYDLTNGAILKQWSWTITVSDMIWGMLASAVGAVVGFWSATKVAP